MIAKLSLSSDVVYLNGLVFEGIIATRVLLKKPVVVKVVGDLVWEKARNSLKYSKSLDSFQSARLSLAWMFLRKLQSLYTSKATLVITPSFYLKNIVEGWGVPKRKIVVVYNSVALHGKIIRPSIKPDYDFISVSRLVSWKGIEALIFLAAKNNWRLRVVGDGPLRSSLEKLALKIQAPVFFAGEVDHSQVFSEISNSKVFVLNSSYEGLPHIVLEAKISGVPVVATDAGGTVETINHMVDGLIVPVNNETQLELAIRKLLTNVKLRRELVRGGTSQVIKKFSYEAMVKKTIENFESAINKAAAFK